MVKRKGIIKCRCGHELVYLKTYKEYRHKCMRPNDWYSTHCQFCKCTDPVLKVKK